MGNKKKKNKKTEIVRYDDFSKGMESLEKQKLDFIDKAYKSDNPELIMKAANYMKTGELKNVTGAQIKSFLVDPLEFSSSFGFKQKNTRLTYNMLRRMSQTPFTAVTINTRIHQVKKFGVPQQDDYSVGFKIRLKNRKIEPTKQDQIEMEELTQYILDCGQQGHQWGTDDFETFLDKIVRDSLTYDQYTFEIKEDSRGIPQEWLATDASTYRVTLPDDGTMDLKPDPLTGQKTYPYFVQIYNESIESEFYPWELAWGIRRPRTDIYTNPYGFAELEELVNVVTSMLYSDEYNRRFFSQGSAPKGILRVSGENLAEEKVKAFKRQWQAQMAGVYNSWKTPIMEADKMEFIDLSKNNRDMEFSQWQEYLIKLHSALFLIDPSEMGFDISQGSNQSGGMFESDNSKRIKYSRDKGLVPILRNIAKKINVNIISRINPKYEFAFVGEDAINEDVALDRAIKELGNFKQLDEVRAKFDLDPLGEPGGGDLILNPQWITWKSNQMLTAEPGEESEEGLDIDNEDGLDMEDEEGLEETEKAVDENPFAKELKDYIKKI